MDIEQWMSNSEWVRSVAHSLVTNPDDAEDIMQDAWMATLEKAPDKPESQRSWLRKVMRNLAYLGFRSRSRRQSREVAAARPESVPRNDSLERLEVQSLLTRVILDLDDIYRQAIVLRYFDGLNNTQISEQLGIETGAVRMRLSRALELVRLRFDTEYGGDARNASAALTAFANGRGTTPVATPTPAGVAPNLLILLMIAAIFFASGWSARSSAPTDNPVTLKSQDLELRLQEAESILVQQADMIEDLKHRLTDLEEIRFVSTTPDSRLFDSA